MDRLLTAVRESIDGKVAKYEEEGWVLSQGEFDDLIEPELDFLATHTILLIYSKDLGKAGDDIVRNLEKTTIYKTGLDIWKYDRKEPLRENIEGFRRLSDSFTILVERYLDQYKKYVEMDFNYNDEEAA